MSGQGSASAAIAGYAPGGLSSRARELVRSLVAAATPATPARAWAWAGRSRQQVGLRGFRQAAGIRCSQRLADLVARLPAATETELIALLGGGSRTSSSARLTHRCPLCRATRLSPEALMCSGPLRHRKRSPAPRAVSVRTGCSASRERLVRGTKQKLRETRTGGVRSASRFPRFVGHAIFVTGSDGTSAARRVGPQAASAKLRSPDGSLG
jgi:hypothetical protein